MKKNVNLNKIIYSNDATDYAANNSIINFYTQKED